MMRIKIFFFILFFLMMPIATRASNFLKEPTIRIFRSDDFTLKKELVLSDLKSKNDLSLALVDLGGDGISEIVVGEGKGEKPEVKIYRSDGSIINSFLAYAESFRGGVRVTGGDLDGDGRDEIITSPREGGGPHIRIFDGYGQPKFKGGFFAYESEYRGGVSVASADLNGDGRDEIITASGKNRAPLIKIFNKEGISFGLDIFPLDFSSQFGLELGTIDLGGDGVEEILVSGNFGAKPQVAIYRANGSLIKSFLAYQEGFQGGVNVSAFDLDGDAKEEIITGAGFMGGPQVRIFDGYGQMKFTPGFFAFSRDFAGGIRVAGANIDEDKNPEIIVLPQNLPIKEESEKIIEVNLSEQRLYAYEKGFLIRSFLISSGISIFPTPQGEFEIYKKRKSVRMTWYYGDGSPYNYDLPGVPNVLSFEGPYALHGTYWHNNFGRPMSHGCVNLSEPDAAWLYDWAPLGTKVVISL